MRLQEGACLNVTLVGASDLMAKDIGGASDPACVLQINDQVFKSSNQFKTLNPVWMEHFQFVGIDKLEVSDGSPPLSPAKETASLGHWRLRSACHRQGSI